MREEEGAREETEKKEEKEEIVKPEDEEKEEERQGKDEETYSPHPLAHSVDVAVNGGDMWCDMMAHEEEKPDVIRGEGGDFS